MLGKDNTQYVIVDVNQFRNIGWAVSNCQYVSISFYLLDNYVNQLNQSITWLNVMIFDDIVNGLPRLELHMVWGGV
jgi:hypothetical protein